MELTGSNAIASSSCSPYSLPVVEYEVFLSFRGPDVRTTFADFLYRLLDRPKIRTFLDDEELRKGEMISPSLVKAIGESRIYIPILSPGYASSKWCLQELALMLERYKQDEGSHIILPIFYLMEPRDVRHCKGSYEEALEQHRLKYGEETIRVWKDALEEVGQMTGWRVTESDRNILPNLRWLRLHYCRSIPININITKLAVLDLRFCPVRDDWRCWDKIKAAHRLKAIDVSFCDQVTKVPNLFGCPSLQRINFLGCGNMSGELHIGDLKGLRVLNIARTKITKLIGGFGRLQNLQEINILVLDRLDIEVPKLPTSLKGLSLSSPRVPNLLELKDLEWLHWSRALLIPGDMWKLSKLKDLELWQVECSTRTLILSSPTLPSSLNTLSISGYQFVPLERLPNLVNQSNLTYLDLSEIGVHEIAGLGELRMLENFDLRDASNLIDLDGLQHLKLLKELRVYRCDVLRKLPSLSNLTKLQTLKIFRCPLLSEIHGLSELAELSTLRIIECRKLTGVMGIDKLESLQVMKIRDCSSIEELPDVSALEHLRELKITGCNQLTEIEKLPDLSALEHLRELKITGCNQLTEVIGLGKLESLRELMITDCALIKKLPDLSALEHLWALTIIRCNQLPEVAGIERLKSLELLELTECTSIERLPDLSALEHLRNLKITGCNQLTEVIGLDKLESLQALRITDCASIKKLPDLFALEHLRELIITGCNQLTEVTGIERLKWSRYFTIDERLKTQKRLEHERWELLHRANNSRPKKWSRFHSCWGVCRKDSDIISL
ncbi:unnamed protein product [Linum tenue]|uniref:TIR domain-containing protein n=1 Tax=Linum tenue TaxID=586396 RepID=A0AAV0LRN3_9ROSI|nr:unnamed protein product [Linum tenue]